MNLYDISMWMHTPMIDEDLSTRRLRVSVIGQIGEYNQ